MKLSWMAAIVCEVFSQKWRSVICKVGWNFNAMLALIPICFQCKSHISPPILVTVLRIEYCHCNLLKKHILTVNLYFGGCFLWIPDMLLTHEKGGCICSLPKDPLFDRHQFSVCQSWVLHVALELEPSNKGTIVHVVNSFFSSVSHRRANEHNF